MLSTSLVNKIFADNFPDYELRNISDNFMDSNQLRKSIADLTENPKLVCYIKENNHNKAEFARLRECLSGKPIDHVKIMLLHKNKSYCEFNEDKLDSKVIKSFIEGSKLELECVLCHSTANETMKCICSTVICMDCATKEIKRLAVESGTYDMICPNGECNQIVASGQLAD